LDDVFVGIQAIRDFIDKQAREGEQSGVRFMTMHAAKGLDATAVIIPGAEDELIPGKYEDERQEGDERRLLYVSLTRAKRYLFVTYSAKRFGMQARAGRGVPNHRLTRFLEGVASPEPGVQFLNSLP
jgi:DNA helicase-2/ATP-dependent DNA helicase PcrA